MNLYLRAWYQWNLKKNVLVNFEKRFSAIQKDTKLVIATLLDPRYKKLYITDNEFLEIAVNSINNHTQYSEEFVCTENHKQSKTDNKNDEDDFWSYHDQLIECNNNFDNANEEFKLYLEQGPIPKNSCGLAYWQSRPDSPLKKLALKYFSLIATSVPSQRLFSKLGQIYTAKRNRLKPHHANELLFLGSASDNYWHL